MKSYRFYIVDVFAEEKYAGNQLAVVLDADTLSTAEMQRIARETNFSETTFVTSAVERDGGYDVRIFTPNEELPFAGHPTLGTAFVIRREIIRSPCAGLALNLEVGQIPVTFQVTDGGEEVLWMRQQPPTFGARGIAPENIAPVLGIEVAEIDVRVDLRRGKPPMSKQLLYLADVCFAFQKMRRAGVTQCVRRDVLFDVCRFVRLFDYSSDVVGKQLTAASGRDEQSDLSGFGRKDGTRFSQVKFDGCFGGFR